MASGGGNVGGDGGEKIKWMYDGPKSEFHREDYLLGKKIDKNFELFSDVVIKDVAEERQQELFQGRSTTTGINRAAPSSSSFKESVLETDIVRKEDPLVMLRLREEQRKRAVLENPLMQMKIKRVLKEAFEKERKGKKCKRRDSKSSSSDSDHGHHGRQPRRDASRSERSERNRREGHERGDREESRHGRRTHHRDGSEEDEGKRRHGRGYSKSKRSPSPRPRREESSRRCEHREGGHGRDRDRSRDTTSQRLSSTSTRRVGLSDEEKAARLAAMTANVKWREEAREENLQHAKHELQRELEEAEKDRGSHGGAFTKAMLSAATASSTVEKRLQSTKAKLQRSHDYMEKSFVRKH